MPHVSTHYRIYLGAAHHRRPRNPQPWVEPDPPSEADVDGMITPFAPPTLAYMAPTGVSTEARFVFWSINDGVVGRTQTSRPLSLTATDRALTLIAWYYLPPSDGPGGGGSAVLIDAYSVELGNFVDDDFVTVTSDLSLSASANVTGRVPTTAEQTIQAFGNIPTGEGFEAWVTSAGESASAVGDVLTAPAGSGGLCIATYTPREITVPDVTVVPEGVRILFGLTAGGSGLVWVHGVGPVPVDPDWGSHMARLMTALGVYTGTSQLSKEGAHRVQVAALGEITAAAEELANTAKKRIEG